MIYEKNKCLGRKNEYHSDNVLGTKHSPRGFEAKSFPNFFYTFSKGFSKNVEIINRLALMIQ